MLTIEKVRETYTRLPSLARPRDIYLLNKRYFRPDNPYEYGPTDPVHQFNAALRGSTLPDGGYIVRGMYQHEAPRRIVIYEDGETPSLVHESLHLGGISSEQMAHAMAPSMADAARLGIGVGRVLRPFRGPADYHAVPVTGSETQRLLDELGVANISSRPLVVTHLTLTHPDQYQVLRVPVGLQALEQKLQTLATQSKSLHGVFGAESKMLATLMQELQKAGFSESEAVQVVSAMAPTLIPAIKV